MQETSTMSVIRPDSFSAYRNTWILYLYSLHVQVCANNVYCDKNIIASVRLPDWPKITVDFVTELIRSSEY